MGRLFAAVFLLAAPAAALGWDAHGHRTITYLALDGLPAEMPAFLRDANMRNRIADEANEPDRWRGTKHAVMAHENNQDHYLDIDLLDEFGLTLDTLPPLRNEYLRALIIAKHEHPDKVRDYDARKDPSRSTEWPGALPYAIMEHWVKLQSAFQTLRILEKLNDPQRSFQLETARNNVAYHMGMLSHFIGDAGQPLHTTLHHHGWVGDNPNGYTTDNGFHTYIDGGCIEKHRLTCADVRPLMKYDTKVDMENPWRDALGHIRASHELVEPLYRMEKAGELLEEKGKKFLAARLAASAEMLRAFYVAAWLSSAPDLKAEQDFVRYNNLKIDILPTESSPPPASAPADGTQSRGKRRDTKEQTRAKVDVTRNLVTFGFRTPLDLFRMNCGRYPTTAEGLDALLTRPADEELGKKWAGPYVNAGNMHDPWGQDLVYMCPGVHNPREYDLSSPGPNGVVGDEDDITNWKKDDR